MKLPTNFLDIVKHKPSGRQYLVYYAVHNYHLKSNTVPNEDKYTDYWSWKWFGGLGDYGGSSVELVAKRFTFKWFKNLFSCLKK